MNNDVLEEDDFLVNVMLIKKNQSVLKRGDGRITGNNHIFMLKLIFQIIIINMKIT